MYFVATSIYYMCLQCWKIKRQELKILSKMRLAVFVRNTIWVHMYNVYFSRKIECLTLTITIICNLDEIIVITMRLMKATFHETSLFVIAVKCRTSMGLTPTVPSNSRKQSLIIAFKTKNREYTSFFRKVLLQLSPFVTSPKSRR